MSQMNRNFTYCFVGAALFAVSAAPVADPEELIRRGNSAYAQGDYRTALDCFAKAADKVVDPGWVAGNMAAAHYQLGNYRQAEQLYRAGLSDAVGIRQSNLLYGLANCLVQEASAPDVRPLREALTIYFQALESADSAERQADIRHNLEVAKLMLIQARAQGEKEPEKGGPESSDQTEPPEKTGSQFQIGEKEPGGGKGQKHAVGADTHVEPQATDQKPGPGKGSLAPVPDSADAPAIEPADAVAYIRQAAARIIDERQKHKHLALKKPAQGVKDW